MEFEALIAAFCILGLFVALGLLGWLLTEPCSRRAQVRAALVLAVNAISAAAVLLGARPVWAAPVATLALLFSLLTTAIALALSPSLETHAEQTGSTDSREAAWWPQFERRFNRYASGPQRSETPLCAAVARSSARRASPSQLVTGADRRRRA